MLWYYLVAGVWTVLAQTRQPLDTKEDISDEKHLLHDLHLKYDFLGKDGRPVRNASQPVKVEFGLGLIKMELMEKENMLVMSTWARYRWRDEYLQWDPLDYGNVSSVKISPQEIWKPDIMLYNTATTDEAARSVQAVVRYDGTVSWFPHQVFMSSCAVDVRNFPFDNQTCHLWFGSWTHTLQELDLDLAFPSGIDLSTFNSVYKDASEWRIGNRTAVRMIEPPDGSPNSQYPILSLTLHLDRKMMFSTYILTMPAIFLSFLTLLVFWLPPEHADKSALGLTIFGSLLLLLLILVEAAPPTASAVPLLGLYYCFTTVIVILSIFLSSLVLKVGKSGTNRKPVPSWVRLVFLKGLGRILCMNVPCLVRSASFRRKSSNVDKEFLPKEDRHVMKPRESVMTREFFDEFKLNGSSSTGLMLLESRLRSLQELIRIAIDRQNEKDRKARHQMHNDLEWARVALVLDRFFFVCYLLVIIISLVFLFPSTPRK